MLLPAVVFSKRKAGHVRIAYIKSYGEPLAEVVPRLGLGNPPVGAPRSELRDISYAEAHSIISDLMHQDMAYHTIQMPRVEAETLATDFLAFFPTDSTRFLTNRGKVLNASRPHDVPSNPMTSSTFDAGVICLSQPTAGCIWFEDED
jgi:hypothetical protein